MMLKLNQNDIEKLKSAFILTSPEGTDSINISGPYLYRSTTVNEIPILDSLLQSEGVYVSTEGFATSFGIDKAISQKTKPLFIRFNRSKIPDDYIIWNRGENSIRLKGKISPEAYEFFYLKDLKKI